MKPSKQVKRERNPNQPLKAWARARAAQAGPDSVYQRWLDNKRSR